MNAINKNNLKINKALFDFINNEAIPGTDIDQEDFWSNFEKVVHELAPVNKALIQKREVKQKKIDAWHRSRIDKDLNQQEYIVFLKSINYIVEEKEDFTISIHCKYDTREYKIRPIKFLKNGNID